MNKKFVWHRILLFLVVTGGLYLITESFIVSLGILLLLFVADYFMQVLEAKRQKNNG